MLAAVIMAVVGAGIGHAARRFAPKLARVKDEQGIRVPWPEVIGALLFGGAGWMIGFDPARIPVYLYTAAFVGILVTDVRYKLIPDRITFPGAGIGIIASAIWPAWICSNFGQQAWLNALSMKADFAGGFALGLVGAGLGFAAFEAMRRIMGRLFTMEVMGMGDSKLVMLMGAFLGPWGALLGLFLAMICGVVTGVIYTRVFKTPHFPFGPALALGGYLTMFWPSLVPGMMKAMQEYGASMHRGLFLAINLALLGVAIWLMMRVRRRAKEYTDIIEKDYDRLEEED